MCTLIEFGAFGYALRQLWCHKNGNQQGKPHIEADYITTNTCVKKTTNTGSSVKMSSITFCYALSETNLVENQKT